MKSDFDAFTSSVARVLLGGFFALSGANNLLDIPQAADTAAAVGVPAAPIVVIAVAVLKLIFGVMIIVHQVTRFAAMMLFLYVGLSTLIFYSPFRWEDFPQAETIFMRNLAILGGLLYLYSHSRKLSHLHSMEQKHMAARKPPENEIA